MRRLSPARRSRRSGGPWPRSHSCGAPAHSAKPRDLDRRPDRAAVADHFVLVETQAAELRGGVAGVADEEAECVAVFPQEVEDAGDLLPGGVGDGHAPAERVERGGEFRPAGGRPRASPRQRGRARIAHGLHVCRRPAGKDHRSAGFPETLQQAERRPAHRGHRRHDHGLVGRPADAERNLARAGRAEDAGVAREEFLVAVIEIEMRGEERIAQLAELAVHPTRAPAPAASPCAPGATCSRPDGPRGCRAPPRPA